jgi:hypothetical protein
MQVQLSDGTIGDIPDGLSDDAIKNSLLRLDAANRNAKQTPSSGGSNPSGSTLWDQFGAWMRQPAQGPNGPQMLPEGRPLFDLPAPADSVNVPVSDAPPQTTPVFPRDQYPGVNAAIDWMRSNIIHSTPGNFVGNVAADVAASPWDVPAGLANAVIHTAQNYGFRPGGPSYPMAAPAIKTALGVTPITDPWAQRAETAAQIAATSGGGLWSRLVNGIFGEAKGEAGAYAGGKIADATDPRLREGFETAGAVAAPMVPGRKAVAPVTGFLLGDQDAPSTLDAARVVQGVTGAPNTPVTAGQLGGPFVKTIENWLGKLPLVGAPVHSAQSDVERQIQQTRDIAAQTVAGPNATVDTSASAPGIALLNGVRDHVNTAMSTAKPQIDAIESQLGTQNTRGPGGGSAMVDVLGLVNDLNGLKTATDAAGNVRGAVAPEIASKIDAEIANINNARQPENPALHTQLQSRISALQGFLSQSGVDPGVRAQVQAQLQQAQAARDANLKVPFEALRQMKTLQGAETFGDGTPTLNGYMGGKIYDAYGGALQGFADQLDPALGTAYSKATGAYKNAMDLQRTFKNITQGANEQGLTSAMMSGLKGPESIKALAATPVWGQAAPNTIAMLGRTPSGAFDANQFARQWSNATNDAKNFYTRGSPEVRNALDAAATLGSGFRSTGKPERPLTASSLVLTGLAERALSSLAEGRGALTTAATVGAPLAAAAGLESPAFKRALAGQSAPWSFQQNLPAILAIAQAQGRNQGY